MRKLSAVGALAAGTLALSLSASATQVVNDITGESGQLEQTCTQIVWSFATADCTFGRNRENPDSPGAWIGPAKNGGYFAIGSAGDDLNFDPNSAAAIPLYINPPLVGTLTIDDNGTPADGSDDTIWMEFTLGSAARSVQTGQFTRAIQRWATMVNSMPTSGGNPVPIGVSSATANGNGGFDYVIGSRGFPPYQLCNKADNTDCFPTPSAQSGVPTARIWSINPPGTVNALPPQGSVGIERSGELDGGLCGGVECWSLDNTAPGNLGATTTATFTGYSCEDNDPANDLCAVNPIVWGTSGEDAGFDNLVARISTDSSGNITSAYMYWTQEYFIGAFGGVPGYNNSDQMGVFTFTGLVQGSGANDDSFTVLENSSNNTLPVTANDRGFTGPVTVTITTPPSHGSANVSGVDVIYTPDVNYVGQDTFVYQATDGTLTDSGTVTVTVAADTNPAAPDGGINISTQGVAPASASGSLNVTSLPGYSAGNAPATVALAAPTASNGTVTVSGTTVTYHPNAAFFAGLDTFGYQVTDSDGDTDTGVITVTIPDVSPVISDGVVTTDEGTASAAYSPSITLGNGSSAQHILSVTSPATSGTCSVSPGDGSGKLTYTPNADFFGTDSCTLTLVDGNGQSDTAVISITVNEVSNDLILPGGGSSMDVWSLALLGGLPLLRRRRVR